VLAGVARLMAPGATVTALVSVVPRDGLPGLPERHELEDAYARQALMVETRPATAARWRDPLPHGQSACAPRSIDR
jgi:hypothetical protein